MASVYRLPWGSICFCMHFKKKKKIRHNLIRMLTTWMHRSRWNVSKSWSGCQETPCAAHMIKYCTNKWLQMYNSRKIITMEVVVSDWCVKTPKSPFSMWKCPSQVKMKRLLELILFFGPIKMMTTLRHRWNVEGGSPTPSTHQHESAQSDGDSRHTRRQRLWNDSKRAILCCTFAGRWIYYSLWSAQEKMSWGEYFKLVPPKVL